MPEGWRRFGWQQMTFVAPVDWYLDKVSIDRAEGELYLSDGALPRLQIKWLDAAKQKSVDPKATLDRWIAQLEKQARRRRIEFSADRDIKLIKRGKREVSSFESFRWRGDIEAIGLIWYSPAAQRVTLAQVNAPLGDEGLKQLARQVLGSLYDTPQGEHDLWTAYDLECEVPREWKLKNLVTETGHTELTFEQGKESLTIGRWALAEIVLERSGNLGDWAHSQRFKSWITHRLERLEGDHAGLPAVDFQGLRKNPLDRLRAAVYNFCKASYVVALTARAWHCAEANALFLVEHLHDRRTRPLVDELAARIPCAPRPAKPPKP